MAGNESVLVFDGGATDANDVRDGRGEADEKGDLVLWHPVIIERPRTDNRAQPTLFDKAAFDNIVILLGNPFPVVDTCRGR